MDVDLVVIGGGSAGIHAAIQLKDAGAKVVVIEKKTQIGGRKLYFSSFSKVTLFRCSADERVDAETFYAPNGAPLNVGVVVFENSTVVGDYFKRLNVSIAYTNPATGERPPLNHTTPQQIRPWCLLQYTNH